MAFDDRRIPQPPPCKCSAPCRLVCPALAGLHQPLAPVSGVHAVDTFSVTEPVTLIHWYVQCGSCPGRRSLLPLRSSACWSQPNADGVVVPHVGPLVEGKRRELDRRDVCPGDPTGQRERRPSGHIIHPRRSDTSLTRRLRRVHSQDPVPALLGRRPILSGLIHESRTRSLEPQISSGGRVLEPTRCRISAASTARSAQSRRGLGLVLRSIATSWRRTSSSISLDDDVWLSRISQSRSQGPGVVTFRLV